MPKYIPPEMKAEYKANFLVALQELYGNEHKAASSIGCPHGTLSAWRKDDPEFDRDWKDVKEGLVDEVEAGVMERAIKKGGTDAYVILNGQRPEVYRPSNLQQPTEQPTIQVQVVFVDASTPGAKERLNGRTADLASGPGPNLLTSGEV